MPKREFCERCPVGGVFSEEDKTCSIPDPEGSLPLACVGSWAEEKHARIRKYVDISRASRRKFLEGKGGATYLDLFCGPGRARVRGTPRIIDGSCLVAAEEAIKGNSPFTEVHIADTNDVFVSAARIRLEQLGVTVRSYIGPADHTVGQVTAALGRLGLHFAFLDPYDLKSLPFNVIQQLAALERMDMLIHVSGQDLQRNLDRYIKAKTSPLDIFAPGWREAVDTMNSGARVRSQILSYWLNRIRAENMETSQGAEKVTGPNNQNLYWLIFVARHKLAIRFWEEIRNVTNQKTLDF